jgi:mannose-1-phosphate guanylyltransferase/phosphomannomutase
MKGTVMRMLAEREGGPDADYTDGIKIANSHGWALVLPDASEPCFHVYAESSDEGGAGELVREYSERVRKLAA